MIVTFVLRRRGEKAEGREGGGSRRRRVEKADGREGGGSRGRRVEKAEGREGELSERSANKKMSFRSKVR
jgi:hypothetical protein